MSLYGVALMPLASRMRETIPEASQPWYCDDAGAAGLGCAFRRNSGGFRRNSDKRHRPFRFRTGTGAGMCYNTILEIPVYSSWYLSTRFL
jgi:hypothetical protein